MKIIGVSIIKNESDILETFVRHNLGYLDGLVILENRSSDKSRQILERLAFEGLSLIFLGDPEIAHKQSEKMTALIKRAASIINPDWIVPLDADEFLNPDEGETLESILSDIPEGSVGQMEWRTYVPTARDDSQEKDILKRITNRRMVESPQYYKVIIPKSMFNEKTFTVDYGNHAVKFEDGTYPPVPYTLHTLSLAHFPIRSSEQVLTKAFVSWLAKLSYIDRKIDGWRKQELCERFVKNIPLKSEELELSALNYVADKGVKNSLVEDRVKQAASYELKQIDLMTFDPMVSVASISEGLAGMLREATAQEDQNSEDEYSGIKVLSSVGHIVTQSLDVSPFRYVFDTFKPESVLDVGFGGASVYKFQEWGAEVKAVGLIDVNGDVREPDTPSLENVDPSFDLGRKFDLVICSELINMIEPDQGKALIKSLTRHAGKLILFTASQPGQPGEGNVNLQTPDYWIGEWAKEGLRALVFQTLAFRMLSNFSWLKYNPLLLAPETASESLPVYEGFGPDDLKRNNARPKDWSPQKPGVYETTFMGDQEDDLVAQSPQDVLVEADRELRRILLKRARVNFDLGNLEESVSDTGVALAITFKLREPLEESVVDFLNVQAKVAEERKDEKTIARIVSIMKKLGAAAERVAKKST